MPDRHTDSVGRGQGWQQPEKQSKSPHWPLVCRVHPKYNWEHPCPSSLQGRRRIQPHQQGAPLPHSPGDIRAPSHYLLPLSPPLVPQTLIFHLKVRLRRCHRRKDSPLHTVDAQPIAGLAGFWLLLLPGTASPTQI